MINETNAIQLKQTTHCWCGNSSLERYSEDYLLCSACGTLVVALMPEVDLTKVQNDDAQNELYSKNYWLDHSTEDLQQSDIFSRARTDIIERGIYWLRTLMQYKLPPVRTIDVGCGSGIFVKLMEAAGYNASGLEISPWVVELGKKTFDINLGVGAVEQQKFEPESFDVISLMDVVEHLQDPLNTLKVCKDLLKKDGILIIQMPNFSFGKSYETLKKEKTAFLHHMLKDKHLFLFSEAAIVKLLKEKLNIQNIQFEKAVFDHYDMYLFASKSELLKMDQQSVDDFLLTKPDTRLVLFMLDMEDKYRHFYSAYTQADKDRNERLKVIEKLSQVLTRIKALTNKTIAIDLTPILTGGDNGGAKILAIELIKEMAKIMPECKFIVFTSDRSHDELTHQLQTVNLELKCVNLTSADGLKKLDCVASEINFDLLFCPFTSPVYHKEGVPTVSVILDIQYQYYPHFFSEEDRKHRRSFFIETCEKADQIITISDYVKQTVIEHAPSDVSQKIETIYIGLANRLPSIDVTIQNKLLETHALEKNQYLLYPANYWKHKNHEILLTAFAMYLHQYPKTTLKLVCTGAPGERQEYLKSITVKMGIQDKVIFAGFLSNEEFSALFDGCKAIIYPSLFEGFGMPILEALANAKPVLCCNVTSVPEIAGREGAVYFDPRIPTEIVAAIECLEFNSAIIQKNVEYGLRRAEEIGNVTQMAESYLDVFAKVLVEDALAKNKLKPTMTVITPSYNQRQFIERTIESVLSQDIAELEYLVVDGGSKDKTIDVLNQYKGKIRWISEPDKGQTDAINKGIQQTTGEIIGWLNSDDIYYSGTLRRVQQFFAHNPRVDILYGNANHIDVDDNIIEPYYNEAWNVERLKEVCFISQPSVFLRRTLIEKYGLLKEDLNYCMDYEYWLRLALAGVKFHWLRETLAATRMHKDTKTLGARWQVHAEINKMLKHKIGYVPMNWLKHYGSILLEEKTKLKKDSLIFCFLNGFLTLLYSLKLNKKISIETIKVVLRQWKFGALRRGFQYGIRIFKRIINKLLKPIFFIARKLLPMQLKDFLRKFRPT